MSNNNWEGVIYSRTGGNNFEMWFCGKQKKFYLTQLTFNVTSEISKECALSVCENSEFDRADYQDFFN